MEPIADPAITAAAGFSAGAIHAGIKKDGRSLDLCILSSDRPSVAAGVFTRNKVRAAPVKLSEERLRSGRCQAVIVNAGNANACTGDHGMPEPRRVAGRAATKLAIPAPDG